MRLPESKIKAAILHPEEAVRLTALAYFADSFTTDESIMPLVIKSIEKYGRESAPAILRDAERLPQDELSFNWLLNELHADFDLSDVRQDNYRFAVCLALLSAPLELLVEHQATISDCPNFAVELFPALHELSTMASWDWGTGWEVFTGLAREFQCRDVTSNDAHRYARVIRALGRMPEGADQILNLLKGIYRGTDRGLMQWADPSIVELAGEMRLKEAVPLIIDRLFEKDESVLEQCSFALTKIGGDEVVEAISEIWSTADEEIRSTCTETLEHIHTDLSVESCVEFLSAEDDFDTQLTLGHAVLAHFTLGQVDALKELVLEDDDELAPDQWDLRHRLVATVTITGERFPEYDVWHQEAVSTRYGFGDDRSRIAEHFRLDEPEREFEDEAEADDYFEPRVKKVSRNDPCPCGSGNKFKRCCIDKDFEWLEDEDGNIFKSIPMSGELVDLLQDQRAAFVKNHGREPGPDDPVFQGMPHPEHLEHEMVEAMKLANIDPAKIYAFEKTGRLVTEENQDLLTEADLMEWEAAIDEYEERFGRE
jgi:hypothetical protein